MSETIDYYMELSFSSERVAQKFASEKSIREFFSEVHVSGKDVACRSPGGWRGGGYTCKEVLQMDIGKTLYKYKKWISDFLCTATYLEHAPYDSFELLDLEELP